MTFKWLLALVTIVVLNACATTSSSRAQATAKFTSEPLTEDLRSPTPQEMGEAIVARLPMDFSPVRLEDKDFTAAVLTLLLDTPMRVASANPKWELGVGGSGQEAWQSELRASYGRFCEQRGTPGDCLTLFDDGPELQARDKRSIALALAVGPALNGLSSEIRAMVDPTRVMATVSFTLAAYLALCVAPEPISKGVALAFSVLMWGYLGVEFFDLLRAYVELHHDAAQATSFEELREVGNRFGQVIGPNSVRILVMVGTAAVGETASLLSKTQKLPGFLRVSSKVEAKIGVPIREVLQSERVFISVSEGVIRSVLPATAVAMTVGARAWQSHSGFKRAMGSAGKGKQWHHLVEQTPSNVNRFGAEAVHNTENVVPLEENLHADVSAFYSSIREGLTGSSTLTVRQWLSTQPYEAQRQFGLNAIDYIRRGIWKVR